MAVRGALVLQVLSALGTIGVAVYLALRSSQDVLAIAGLFAFVAFALLQVAGSLLAQTEPRREDRLAPATNGERHAGVDAVIDRLAPAMRRFLAAQKDYQQDLGGFNRGLAQAPSRVAAQDIIVALMNRNLAMQAKVDELSRNLEASQQQILGLKQSVGEAERIALTDALTSLGNRRFFDTSLAAEVSSARATGRDLCLAMVDIDRFKAVNDRFGHAVGDQLLEQFGEILARAVKSAGVPARYGGEEFAILFPGVSLEKAVVIVENVRRELETRRWVVGDKGERLGAVTASFGVARLARGELPERLVERADARLLRAKKLGRNRVFAEGDEGTAAAPARAAAG